VKILIAYYSRTGGTEKVAEALKKELETRGHPVDVEKVKPIKEHGFLYWWHLRMIKGECEIQSPKIRDVSKYDTILIGSPNWTRVSLPIARYLKEVSGLKYKNVGLFSATAAPPAFEWYILSAYLLDLTFSKIVEGRGGRVIDSLLLSSILKKWRFDSEYGKMVIKKFCQNVTAPIYSFKDYFLKHKEIENIRFSVVAFSTLLVFTLILHIILQFLDRGFLNWGEYLWFALIFLFTSFLLTTIQGKEQVIFWGKYIGGFSAVLLWTLTIFYLEPTIGLGRLIISGYILIFIILGFFRDQRTVIFSGLMSFLSYGALFYLLPAKEIFRPALDLGLLLGSGSLVAWITNSLQRYYSNLLEIQDEIETARTTLEIKVKARTEELEELAESLDEKVKEKTKELQERLEELEKFHRLAVGRELRMINLKKEIKKLKEELKTKI